MTAKAILYDKLGKKKGDVSLPSVFSTTIRKDMAQRVAEIERLSLAQPYATFKRAGLRQSAYGAVSHKRHDWKGHYGKAMSRAPRKTMWRRGTQFFWVGANAPGTRGGRRAHPPKGSLPNKKINKKEKILALNSAIASTANSELVMQRYATLAKKPMVPAVIESLPNRTKDLISMIKLIFGDISNLTMKQKKIRKGVGKNRGRPYKSSAGVLIITGEDEKVSLKGFDITAVKSLSVLDLYPLGRLSIFTKKALEELK